MGHCEAMVELGEADKDKLLVVYSDIAKYNVCAHMTIYEIQEVEKGPKTETMPEICIHDSPPRCSPMNSVTISVESPSCKSEMNKIIFLGWDCLVETEMTNHRS